MDPEIKPLIQNDPQPVSPVQLTDVVGSNNPTPKSTAPKPKLPKKTLYLYVGLGFLAVFVIGLVVSAQAKFARFQNSKNVAVVPVSPSPTPVASIEEEVVDEPSPSPSVKPSPSPSPKVSPSVKPSVSPSPSLSPSPSPTPTVIVDNTFTCGTYSGDSYPALPAYGKTPLSVTLYPSGGTSGGISLTGFEWDFDGDGVWEGGVSASKVGRTYDKSATFNPKFRAKGNNGAVGPTCTYPYPVVAGGSTAYENDILMVDKLSVEVTISKSKNNYTFNGSLAKYNNDASTIYVPFVIISTKKDARAIVTSYANNTAGGNYGATTGTPYMDSGTAYYTQLWVSKTIANGTYEGTMKIQYKDPSGVTSYDATNATYKITVTD